ncbi:MAG: acyl-[acyl-carrier-protein] thioesterase, partial [Dorea sp.]|nr:acyl-[acyl-carrier-protein] thioesterase [Dorea sp.]
FPMEYAPRKIVLPKDFEYGEAFPVRKYHIDTNEHVNNCQYVQMALEVIKETQEVRQLRVEYKKSAVYGDIIYPRTAKEEGRTVVELCDKAGKPYAAVEFQ